MTTNQQSHPMPTSLHLTIAFLLVVCGPLSEAGEKAAGQTWSFTPNATLPDVLIVGDSISIGYTLLVRSRLAGVANVHRPLDTSGKKPANGGDTAHGLINLDAWLGNRTWRVIHFNFGLHDMKYLDANGKYVSPDQGKQVALPDPYEANLKAIVARLKKTGAILIWATTTPVPDGATGRVKGDDVIYNVRAKKVMDENGVLINDFGVVLDKRLPALQLPRNVHFNDQGSQVLADAVAASITAALAKPWTPPDQTP
jgi:acyl-CoA thioesterase-1